MSDVKRYAIYGADEDGPHHMVNSAGQTADNLEDGTEFVLAADFVKALREYGEHKADCHYFHRVAPSKCSCGFDTAIDLARGQS